MKRIHWAAITTGMLAIMMIIGLSCGPPPAGPEDPQPKPVAAANTAEVTLAVTGMS